MGWSCSHPRIQPGIQPGFSFSFSIDSRSPGGCGPDTWAPNHVDSPWGCSHCGGWLFPEQATLGRGKDPGCQSTSFYNLTGEWHHHFCHLLLLKQTEPCCTWERTHSMKAKTQVSSGTSWRLGATPGIMSELTHLQRNQRSNCQHPLDHGKSKRVPEKHLFLLYWLC